MRKNQISTFLTVNEIRKEEGLEDIAAGDVILNPIYSQRQAMLEQQEQEAQQQEMAAQQQEQEQDAQTKTGEKEKSGKEADDPTGAAGTAKHQALEPAGGPGKDQRLPQGTDKQITF